MDDLIKALQIFLKYENLRWPTGCEHDILYVYVVAKKVSAADIKELDRLGFIVDERSGNFKSYRFGSG